jgi:hypothetical protein
MDFELLKQILPVILTLGGGAIGWFLKSKIEAKQRLEDSLRNESAKVYLDILMPFAILFTDLSKKSQEETLKQIKSKEYRELSFKLILIGSEDVVRSWNEMWGMVYAIEGKKTPDIDPASILLAFGNVLLSVRKSLGHSKTAMENKDMLRWLIKDIDTLSRS